MPELISCVCPTWNRPEMLPRLVANFHAQTYPTKQLLIFDDSRISVLGTPFGDSVKDKTDIKYIYRSKRKAIPAKRNILCEATEGDIICHMDDDDESSPTRLEHQYDLMKRQDVPITGYHTILFYEDSTHRVFRYFHSIRFALGASLMFRKHIWENNHFDELSFRGSDIQFFDAVHKQAFLTDGTDYLVAHIHSKGTNPRPVDTDPFYEAVDLKILPDWFGQYEFKCV